MSVNRMRFLRREQYWKVRTADGAEIEYLIARTGVRVAAFLLDTIFRYSFLLLFYMVLYTVYGRGLGSVFMNPDIDAGIAVALLILLDFLLQWGYFALFELYYSGQTPGKRICGIQVLDRGGFTPSPSAIMLRNLIRFVDNLPVLHFLAVCVSSIDRYSRRLGDIVADTIVVYAKKGLEPFPRIVTRQSSGSASSFPGINRLQEKDIYYIRRFLEGRDRLNRDTADKLAQGLAEKIAGKIGHEASLAEPSEFLERILDAYADAIQE